MDTTPNSESRIRRSGERAAFLLHSGLLVVVALALLTAVLRVEAGFQQIDPRLADPGDRSSLIDSPTDSPAHEQLPSASSREHWWFIAPGGESGETLRLHHHALGMRGAYFRTPTAVPHMPQRMAADANSLWIVFGNDDGSNDLYLIKGHRNEATGLYYHLPPRGLDLLGRLPDGLLVGMSATSRGPIVALLDSEHPESSTLRLLRFDHSNWTPIDTPPLQPADGEPANQTLEHHTRFWIVAGESLLRVIAVGDESLIVWQRADEAKVNFNTEDSEARPPNGEPLLGPWERFETALGTDRAGSGLIAVFEVGPRLTAVFEDVSTGSLHLDHIRDGELIPFATTPLPPGPYALAGMAGDVRLVWWQEGRLHLRTIDLLGGAAMDHGEMISQPLSDPTSLYLPVVLSAVIFAMIIVILLRRPVPAEASEHIALPQGVRPAPLARRAMATLIDLAAPSIIALIVLRETPEALLRSPLWTIDMTESAAVLFAAVLTAAHATVGEWRRQRSFGKMVMGMRVASIDGSRPLGRQIIIRNAMKVIVLIMPPLAVFVLVSPYRQRLGDVIARTVVVEDAVQAPAEE